MTIISGGCTPSVTVEVDFDENPNGLPVVWLKTGHKQGVHAPLNKEAVEQLIADLQEKLRRM
jgi:hypothetical protein